MIDLADILQLRKPGEPLTPIMRRAVEYICRCNLDVEILQKLNVDADTLALWRNDPEFQAAVEARDAELRRDTMQLSRAAWREAMGVQIELMRHPDPKVAGPASRFILERLRAEGDDRDLPILQQNQIVISVNTPEYQEYVAEAQRRLKDGF